MAAALVAFCAPHKMALHFCSSNDRTIACDSHFTLLRHHASAAEGSIAYHLALFDSIMSRLLKARLFAHSLSLLIHNFLL